MHNPKLHAEPNGLKAQDTGDFVVQICNWYSNLFSGIAVPDSHCVVFERFKVDNDTLWRANLVLTAVATSDRLSLVVLAHVAL